MTKPFIIAEMSCNHGGNIEDAFRIIKAAKDNGADAVKLQTYTPDCLTIDADIVIAEGKWKGRRLYDLYKETAMPMDWHAPLFDYAKGQGIEIFSSVFGLEGLHLLESLSCPRYKIASFELVDEELVRAVAATGKPIIASVGAASDAEAMEAYKLIHSAGCRDITFLHCISEYPAVLYQLDLGRIGQLKRYFGGRVKIGFSDHTMEGVSDWAIIAGAEVLERHIAIFDVMTEDYTFSSTGDDLFRYIGLAHLAAEAIRPSAQPQGRHLRRSIYCIRDMERGEPFTRDTVRVIRPGDGLHPNMLHVLLESVAAAPIKRGEPITTNNADITGVC